MLFFLLIIMVGLLAFCIVLAVPVSWTVQALFLAGFVVVGPVIYFSGMGQISWLFYFATALLIFKLIAVADRKNSLALEIRRPPGFVLYIGAFLLIILIASIIENPRLGEILISFRWYFFVWPVMLAFMMGEVSPHIVERIWRLLLVVGLFQLPMALFQYFIVARISARSSPWDAVVGTFPGQMDGGGQSAAMGVFLLIMFLLAFALWRRKFINIKYFTVLLLGTLVTLLLAEVKAAILLMPVTIALFYRQEIFRRPIQAVLLTAGSVGVVLLLFSGYEAMHYSHEEVGQYSQYNEKTTMERVLGAIDPENDGEYTDQLGRVTHLVFWWRKHIDMGDIRHMFLGYGMGSTEITNFLVGEVAGDYPFPMDVTSSTILLWETGLLGHLLFIIILLRGSLVSTGLSRNLVVPEFHRIALRVGGVGLLLLIMTLPYKNFALRSFPISLLLMLLLGQTAYWWQMVRGGRRVTL